MRQRAPPWGSSQRLDNLCRGLPPKLRVAGVFQNAAEGGEDLLGRLVWIRRFTKGLKDRLPLGEAEVHERVGTCFYVGKPGHVTEDEKDEIMRDADTWPDGLGDDLHEEKCIKDFIPFAKAFLELLGENFETDSQLQRSCLLTFSRWAPDVRTRHENYGNEQVTRMVQVPAELRRGLPYRFQTRNRPGVRPAEEQPAAICGECGKAANGKYCSTACAQVNAAQVECPCGSKNVCEQVTKVPHTENAELAAIWAAKGPLRELVCRDCNRRLFHNLNGHWLRSTQTAAKRGPPEDHVPECLKRRRV